MKPSMGRSIDFTNVCVCIGILCWTFQATYYQDSTVPVNHKQSMQWLVVGKRKLRPWIRPNADHQKPAVEAVIGCIWELTYSGSVSWYWYTRVLSQEKIAQGCAIMSQTIDSIGTSSVDYFSLNSPRSVRRSFDRRVLNIGGLTVNRILSSAMHQGEH